MSANTSRQNKVRWIGNSLTQVAQVTQQASTDAVVKHLGVHIYLVTTVLQ